MKRLLLTLITISAALTAAMAAAPTPQEILFKARAAMVLYDFDEAETHYKAYQNALKKKRLPADTVALREEQSISRLQDALQNVEDIIVFDSIAIGKVPEVWPATVYEEDSTAFIPSSFGSQADWQRVIEIIELPQSAGSLRLASTLPFIEIPEEVDGPVFLSADSITAMWSAPGARGINVLYEGTRLSDGSWHIEQVPDIPAPAYSPFLIDDGMTLYYTTDAYPTLGGRDVMMATRDAITEPWRQPANPGMPLNSIYDEVLYVTDATDSIGWIVTMRNFPDTFEPTVYVLKLNDMRTNLDPDSVDIQSRAFIRNIEDTWPEGFDAGEWQLRVEEARSIKNQVPVVDNSPILPDGRTLKECLKDGSAEQKRAIESLLDNFAEMRRAEKNLDTMRMKFGQGDTSNKKAIIDAEIDIDYKRAKLQQQYNKLLKNLGYK